MSVLEGHEHDDRIYSGGRPNSQPNLATTTARAECAAGVARGGRYGRAGQRHKIRRRLAMPSGARDGTRDPCMHCIPARPRLEPIPRRT
jgi:hypothetical protein